MNPMGGVWAWLVGALGDLGIALGGMTTVLVFTRTWWLPAWRGWRARRQARAAMPGILQSFVADFAGFKAFVDHELRPNNQSSIRDAIDRIEKVGMATSDRMNMVVGMIRHAADTSHEGSFEADAAGCYLWVNATFLRWTAQQLEHCTGWGWINTIHHRDRDRVRSEWEDAVSERRAFSSVYALIDTSGQRFMVECKASPLRDAAGNVTRWMGNLTPYVESSAAMTLRAAQN